MKHKRLSMKQHQHPYNLPHASQHHDGTELGMNAPTPTSYKQNAMADAQDPDYGMDPNSVSGM